jgi:hypothetical protein
MNQPMCPDSPSPGRFIVTSAVLVWTTVYIVLLHQHPVANIKAAAQSQQHTHPPVNMTRSVTKARKSSPDEKHVGLPWQHDNRITVLSPPPTAALAHFHSTPTRNDRSSIMQQNFRGSFEND